MLSQSSDIISCESGKASQFLKLFIELLIDQIRDMTIIITI